MDIIINLNNQSNGRDKLARLFQYTSRLLWHQLEARDAHKYSIDRVRNLEQSLSSFRKILRLGRCVDICYLAMNCSQIDNPFLRLTLTTSKLAHSLFLYSDHVVWLTKAGFLRTDADKWNRTANKFWLLSIIANLARDLYEILHLLDINHTSLLKPSELIASSAKVFNLPTSAKQLYMLMYYHKDIFIDTFKNSCDIFIPLTALGFTKLSPSAVGTLGALSSLAALITIVQPMTKLVPS